MRKALNENPMVQIGVLAVIGVVFAFLLFNTVLKKDDAPAAEPATTVDASAATDSAATDPAATADPAVSDPAASDPAAADPAAAVPPAASPLEAPAAGDPGSADGLLPTKGLPKDVLVAYAKDKAIALLVVDPKGISDRVLKSYTKRLEARDGVAVFIVDVKHIIDYARITSGVAVNRAPALVVIRPRKLTGSVPTASVSYGFRSPRSVQQALDDALYQGKQLPAYP